MCGTGQNVYCGGWLVVLVVLVVLKAALVFIFGPNLKTRTLLQPRPKLTNMKDTRPWLRISRQQVIILRTSHLKWGHVAI